MIAVIVIAACLAVVVRTLMRINAAERTEAMQRELIALLAEQGDERAEAQALDV